MLQAPALGWTARSARCARCCCTGRARSSNGSRRATTTNSCSTASPGWTARRPSTTRSPRCCAAAASRCCCWPTCWSRRCADARAHAAGVHAAVDELRLGDDLADALRSHLSSVCRRSTGHGADGRHDVRGAAGRRGRVAGAADAPAARLRRRPAAEPAVHQGLVGVDRRPGGHLVAEHAGPAPRVRDHRPDLRLPPALRAHRARVRRALGAGRGRRRAGAGAGRARASASASGPRRPAPSRWRARRSPTASRTPCWRCRSRRSGPPCTWTRCAPWSTRTRW